MADIEENENGIENTLIDPFMTVSTEAFPFPIEQYIPPKPVTAPLSDDVQTIPEAVETQSSFQALMDEKETSDELTDTPQEPLPSPDIDEEETRVSFEIDDTEIKTNLLLLEELVNVHDRLKLSGGICKDDVYQVESLVPGLLTNHRHLNSFSVIPTPVSLGISLESIETKIKNVVLSLISALIDHAISFGKWLATHIGSLLLDKRDLQQIKKRWDTVISIANRVDGVNGRDAFKRRYPDESLAKKASTNTHYITMLANQYLKEKGLNTRNGLRLVETGALYADVKEQVRAFTVWQQDVSRQLYQIEKDQSTQTSKTDKDKVEQQYAKLKAQYDEPSSLIFREITKALNIKDGIYDTRDDIRSIDKFLKDFVNTLKSLEKKYQGAASVDQNAKENLKYLQSQLTVMKVEMKIVDLQLSQFESYYGFLSVIVGACERRIRAIDLTTRP